MMASILYKFKKDNKTRLPWAVGAFTNFLVGDNVQLNGSGSRDPDEDTLSYVWSIITKPEGSSAALSDSSIVNPTFIADKAGAYVLELVVNDGALDSNPDQVRIFVSGVDIDINPPNTTIVSAVDRKGVPVVNGGSTRSNSITFEFTGFDANGVAGFECSLDDPDPLQFAPCSSPLTFTRLGSGLHTFYVRAIDTSENRDDSPASFSWTKG